MKLRGTAHTHRGIRPRRPNAAACSRPLGKRWSLSPPVSKKQSAPRPLAGDNLERARYPDCCSAQRGCVHRRTSAACPPAVHAGSAFGIRHSPGSRAITRGHETARRKRSPETTRCPPRTPLSPSSGMYSWACYGRLWPHRPGLRACYEGARAHVCVTNMFFLIEQKR